MKELMHLKTSISLIILTAVLGLLQASAQQAPAAATSDTTCTFQDGTQITIRYPQVQYSSRNEPREGKAWVPDNQPTYLFSQTTLKLSGVVVPPGAYSVFMVPSKDHWTIALNKDVKSTQYDAAQDIAKIQADVAPLPDSSKSLTLYFGHVSPKTCTLRVDYGKQRAFADFTEQ